jgi:hypothetical protein
VRLRQKARPDPSFFYLNPPIISLGKLLYNAISETNDDVKSGDLEELRIEEAKQEVSMRMAERQARVAQELAIAERIRDADEVAIEEYYDTSIEGGATVGVSESGISAGLNGKNGVVSKRIYRFSKRNESVIEYIQE